jgi:hypothetical protein
MLQLKSDECAEPVVQALIEAYRSSQYGSTGTSRRDFSVRYDKLVHKLARATVADEKRGRAVLERLRSAGLIRWDHTPLQRDRIKTIYITPTSEKDLFMAVGELPPTSLRTDAVVVIAKHTNALNGHLHEGAWKAVLQQAMDDVHNGRSAEGLPNESLLHDEVLRATAAVLWNEKPILIRRLSAEKLNDSKLLQRRRETVERFMAQFLPPDFATMEAWQVGDALPTVLVRGSLGVVLKDGSIIEELSRGSPYAIKEELLASAETIFTSCRRCLNIENQTTFREIVETNADDIIVHTSYPSRAVVKLLRLLPTTVELRHWGDTDPWGYDILRVLREKTGRAIQPWRMKYRPGGDVPLSKRESAILSRLIADPLVSDIKSELVAMKTAGSKGFFEQESLPLEEPIAGISPQ